MKKIVMVIVLLAMVLSTFAAHAQSTSSSKIEAKEMFEVMLELSTEANSKVKMSSFSHPMDGVIRIVLSMPMKNGKTVVCQQISSDTGDSVHYECTKN